MWIPVGWLAAGLLAALAVGAGGTWLALYVRGLHVRLCRLEGHGAGRRATVDVTEVAIMDLQQAFAQAKVLDAQMTNGLMRLAWMRHGGDPDANWNEIVTWWNKLQEQGDKS